MTKTEQKLFDGLNKRLNELLDKDFDIFLEERPFLVSDAEPRIVELEAARQAQIEIQFTVKALRSLIRQGLPPVLPPKQERLIS